MNRVANTAKPYTTNTATFKKCLLDHGIDSQNIRSAVRQSSSHQSHPHALACEPGDNLVSGKPQRLLMKFRLQFIVHEQRTYSATTTPRLVVLLQKHVAQEIMFRPEIMFRAMQRRALLY